MPIDPHDVPTVWVRESPGNRTLQELQQAVHAGDCTVLILREPWTYETTLERVWNWMRTVAIGLGIDRTHSIGTAIRIYFTCAEDNQTAERRRVIKSHTLNLTPDCILTITKVVQEQAKVRRDWVRWTLTLTFEDSYNSTTVNSAVQSLLSGFGIIAEGVPNVVTGLASILLTIGDTINGFSTQHVFVSRQTAASQELWVDVGVPSSTLIGRGPITAEWCEYYQPVISTGENGTVTIPAPPNYLDH